MVDTWEASQAGFQRSLYVLNSIQERLAKSMQRVSSADLSSTNVHSSTGPNIHYETWVLLPLTQSLPTLGSLVCKAAQGQASAAKFPCLVFQNQLVLKTCQSAYPEISKK